MHTHTPSTVSVCSFRYFFGVFSLGLLCFLLTPNIPTANAAEVVDRIVAVVNDEIIVLQEVDTEVNNQMQSVNEQIEAAGISDEEKGRILANLRENVINSLVNRRLVVQAAKENEYIEVSNEEIDAQIQSIKDQYNFTDEQFKEALAQDGLSFEAYRTQLEESALYQDIVYFDVTSKIVVTKADVTRYYNDHPEKYQGKTVYHLRNILVKTSSSDSTAAKASIQNKLANIFAELEAGQSFQSVARKYSESAYASEGGELGNFELKDLSLNFRTAIEPLSPGEHTQAIETTSGYQIFFVEEINKESDEPLDSVYNEIEKLLGDQLYQEKLQAWIEGLRENAHIKIIQ